MYFFAVGLFYQSTAHQRITAVDYVGNIAWLSGHQNRQANIWLVSTANYQQLSNSCFHVKCLWELWYIKANGPAMNAKIERYQNHQANVWLVSTGNYQQLQHLIVTDGTNNSQSPDWCWLDNVTHCTARTVVSCHTTVIWLYLEN